MQHDLAKHAKNTLTSYMRRRCGNQNVIICPKTATSTNGKNDEAKRVVHLRVHGSTTYRIHELPFPCLQPFHRKQRVVLLLSFSSCLLKACSRMDKRRRLSLSAEVPQEWYILKQPPNYLLTLTPPHSPVPPPSPSTQTNTKSPSSSACP